MEGARGGAGFWDIFRPLALSALVSGLHPLTLVSAPSPPESPRAPSSHPSGSVSGRSCNSVPIALIGSSLSPPLCEEDEGL